MGTFTCDKCGKCCTGLGRHIAILRQLNERDYYCRCAIDNSHFQASVDPAYREEVAEAYETAGPVEQLQEAGRCIFLKKNADGPGFICAIHATRPAVCRGFRCYRMLIKNSAGEICGKIVGKNSLQSDDPVLDRLWKDQVSAVSVADPESWLKDVAAILGELGYSIDPAE